MYYTTARDLQEFSPAAGFCEPGFSVIDGTIVRNEKQYVLVLKDNTRSQRNLGVAFPQVRWDPGR